MSSDFLLYPKLSTCSKRAIRRAKRRNGMPYNYVPHGNLIRRLSRETGLSIDDVYSRLIEERAEILRESGLL